MEILSAVSSFASVVAAVGVVYAARQAAVVFKQLEHTRDSQAVSIHANFQKEFRELQKQFPPEIKNTDWYPASKGEERCIQLYWELVFDEWYITNILSSENRVADLWKAYAKGVEGAFAYESFVATLKATFSEKAFYLGYSKQFRTELLRVYRNISGNEGKPDPF
ncbi:MAG: hypothetical protein MUF44_13115 [Hydrogenophaga sp.]|jgi:hypothetical protein|nr:hypothetical protein [Hydrogenophaga sp.]